MLVQTQTPNTILTIMMAFPAFLAGPVMSRICQANNDCSAEQLIQDYMPIDANEGNDAEYCQYVEEACVQALNTGEVLSGLHVLGVELEENDIAPARKTLNPILAPAA